MSTSKTIRRPTSREAERRYLIADFCQHFAVRRSSAYDAMKRGALEYEEGVDGKRRIRESVAIAYVSGSTEAAA
jgi:hypothetical protein